MDKKQLELTVDELRMVRMALDTEIIRLEERKERIQCEGKNDLDCPIVSSINHRLLMIEFIQDRITDTLMK